MSCNECGEKPKKACGAFPKAVIEIDNPEKIVLLRKVMVPASMGDESTFPPTIGKYHNVLLEYEASGGIYLYSSDGIPTKLSSDVTELQAQLNALRVRIGEEEVARADADTALSDRITSLDDSLATVAKTGSYNDLSDKPTIGDGTLTIKKNGSNVGTFTANATTNTDVNIVVPTKTSDLANDGSDGASQYVESNDLATVATSGSYNDLTNKPNIGNATLTIKRNDTNAGTFTANATTNKSINIAVPTKTSDLTNDGADGTSTYVESDDLPTVDTTYSSSSNNAIANSTVTNSLDRNVMTNLAVDSTPSTTTVNLSNTKTNLAYPSSSTTSSISLPVASSTQAGVMNSATFDAVTNNTNNINAILNGAVAISNLPASPTQAQLTTAWENETGLTSLINRASVYDVTNNKVWTYYTNDQTWHAASNTSQVTVNTFTNSSEGTIKGSTNDGQVFAENDGTGSVNGWDTLTSTVSSNTSKLATIAQGAEVNVQANWTQTNTNADDYIKNKPANLVQDANYVHTDNNFTTTLKNKLDGIESGAEVNVQADWSQTDTSADDYIKNKPTIPTVNNATLTIQKNGTNVQTFTANSSTNKTANITVPTAVSELTNDAGYATTTQLNNGLATKQDTLTAGDNIQINGNTISATDTTYTAGNAIDITNGEISADIHPADFFTAEDVISDCGSVLWLDDTMASTLKSVELKGDTYQQSYSGKNLLDCNTYSGKAPTADALTGEGYIKVTQNTTGSGGGNSFAYYNIDRADLANQQVTLFAKAVSGGGSTGSRIRVTEISGSPEIAKIFPTTSGASDTFNMPADGKIRIYFYINASNVTGAVGAYTEYSEVQLELGAQATSFEPYVGGIPAPNPDYPQDVQTVTGEQTISVVGKNKINGSYSEISQTVRCTAEASGNGFKITSTASTGAVYATVPIPNVERLLGQTVTVSYVATGDAIRARFYYLNSSNNATSSIGSTETVTLPGSLGNNNGIGVVFYTSNNNSATYNDIQLEIGSTATSYEPYHLQSYTVDLGSIELCKIGDYQDYIYKSGDDWYLHKEVGKTLVTGSSSESWLAQTTNVGYMYRLTLSGVASNPSTEMANLRSDYFTPTTGGQIYNVTSGGYISQLTTAGYIRFNIGDTTDKLSDFKTWLSSHNTTVYYALGTPADIQITNIDLVAQLNALAKAKSYNDQTNIIVTTAGDNLPATLCVEAYRKSLSGVIEAIDNACTCRKNLVVHLPNGMTTYENNDAPIPIPEVLGALKRGQSVFLVDDGLPENVYVVTAASAEDGVWSMRADQTGINANNNDGYWHINGRDDLWRLVEFIPDTPGGEEVTHLVLSNPTTATWSKIGGIVTVYPTSVTVGIDTFASTDVVFTKDDDTTMTVGDLYTALTTGESFEIDLPFGEINAACYSGWSSQAAAIATVENVKLDGSNKQTLDVTSQGRLYEMYASSAPVMVNLPIPGSVLLDERFGVERLTIDDGDTVTSSYRFVVDTYKDTEPFN